MDAFLVAAMVVAILLVFWYFMTHPASGAKSAFWGSKSSKGPGASQDDAGVSLALAELARQNAPGRALASAGPAGMELSRAAAPGYSEQGMRALSAAPRRNEPVYVPKPGGKSTFWAGPSYSDRAGSFCSGYSTVN